MNVITEFSVLLNNVKPSNSKVIFVKTIRVSSLNKLIELGYTVIIRGGK